MKIVVIGTSNSVMGLNGFVKSLRYQHEVTLICSGRTPFYCAWKNIEQNIDTIEDSDLLIVDHYVNDVNFYSANLGSRYRKDCEIFYQYLSTLNVNILNLLFPIQNLRENIGFSFYEFVCDLSSKYKLTILDLNDHEISSSFYRDPLHINHNTSFALGLSLSAGLSNIKYKNKPKGGSVTSNPFRIVELKDIVEPVFDFSNSLLKLNYVNIVEPILIEARSTERLVSIGYLSDENETPSGVIINDMYKFGLTGQGYFHESVDVPCYGKVKLDCVLGQDELTNLMGRGTSKGRFHSLQLVEVIFLDESIPMTTQSAVRDIVNINIDGFIEIASKMTIDNTKRYGFPTISPITVDKLRDVAISLENININISFDLMTLAQIARPLGPLINSKLKDYSSRISAK